MVMLTVDVDYRSISDLAVMSLEFCATEDPFPTVREYSNTCSPRIQFGVREIFINSTTIILYKKKKDMTKLKKIE